MIEDITFKAENINGIKKNYIIIDRFNKNDKKYIIYQEENLDEIYAALYEIKDNKIKIIPIENNIDYDIVDEYLENL